MADVVYSDKNNRSWDVPTKERPTSKITGIKFVTEYRHYRTGKIMKAQDYGYKAWPLFFKV